MPVYALEFLLGQYCSSDDEEVIEQGVQNVKRILADNFVRPDEAQKILSRLRSRGSHTVIDMITVNLNMRENIYQADFSNLGIRGIPIADEYPGRNMIACFVGVSGVLFSSVTSTLKKKRRMVLQFVLQS